MFGCKNLHRIARSQQREMLLLMQNAVEQNGDKSSLGGAQTPTDAVASSSGSSENDSSSMTSNDGEYINNNAANCPEVFTPQSASFDSQLVTPSLISPSPCSVPSSPDNVGRFTPSPDDCAPSRQRPSTSGSNVKQGCDVTNDSQRNSSQPVQMR